MTLQTQRLRQGDEVRGCLRYELTDPEAQARWSGGVLGMSLLTQRLRQGDVVRGSSRYELTDPEAHD